MVGDWRNTPKCRNLPMLWISLLSVKKLMVHSMKNVVKVTLLKSIKTWVAKCVIESSINKLKETLVFTL